MLGRHCPRRDHAHEPGRWRHPLAGRAERRRVGFQGALGAFSEEAVRALVPDAEPIPYTTFEGVVVFQKSGHYGYSVRILPSHPDLAEPRGTGLIHWAQ